MSKTTEGSAQADGKKISKLEAVRQAISALGRDAKPLRIQEFVKSNFHLDVNSQLISNYKPIVAKQLARRGGRRGRKAGAAAPAALSGISLADIRAVKAVVDHVGADKVRQLAEVLGK